MRCFQSHNLGNYLQGYLLLEVTFLWTTTKIIKTGRLWVNAGRSHRLKQLKHFISSFKVLWMEGIHLECAAALKASEDPGSCSATGKLQSSLCFGMRIHQAAGWCSAGQLESFLERATRGTTCTLPFLCIVWILVKVPVYRHFSSELEKLNILNIFTGTLQSLCLLSGRHSKHEGQWKYLLKKLHPLILFGDPASAHCCSSYYVEKQILAYLAIVQTLTCQKKWDKKQKKKRQSDSFP